MNTRNKRPDKTLLNLAGAGDDFSAALEASTGQVAPKRWNDPMSGAQVVAAIEEILISPRPDRSLEVLLRCKILESVLPEIAALENFGEGVKHKDVWAHTKQVIRQAPARPIVRWAALLHDIGKVPTRKFGPDDQVTFIGHPEQGARMFDRIAQRLPFTDNARSRIRFLIASHLRASAYNDTWTDSAIRRFTKDVGDDLDDLLDLSRADITSKYKEKVLRGLRQIDLLAQRITRVAAEDNKPAPLPKGLGNVLLKRFEISPGPKFGRLMQALKEEVESGCLERVQNHDYYVKFLENHPEILALLT